MNNLYTVTISKHSELSKRGDGMALVAVPRNIEYYDVDDYIYQVMLEGFKCNDPNIKITQEDINIPYASCGLTTFKVGILTQHFYFK